MTDISHNVSDYADTFTMSWLNVHVSSGESGKIDISRGVEEAGEVLEEIGDILNERQVC